MRVSLFLFPSPTYRSKVHVDNLLNNIRKIRDSLMQT